MRNKIYSTMERWKTKETAKWEKIWKEYFNNKLKVAATNTKNNRQQILGVDCKRLKELILGYRTLKNLHFIDKTSKLNSMNDEKENIFIRDTEIVIKW